MSGEESKGAVGAESRPQREELFISYSHKDRKFLESFWTYLSPLETDYGLLRWDDSRIKPGDLWLKEIEAALKRAQLALLLVSPHFLTSDFIRRKELPPLFDAAKTNGLKILWLPIRPCSWDLYPQIVQYQAVGPVTPTLSEMPKVKREREMVDIVKRIHDELKRINVAPQAFQQAVEAQPLVEPQQEERLFADLVVSNQWKAMAIIKRLNDEIARAEVERSSPEDQRLVKEKEELERRATLNCPPLIEIPTTRGWLVREGSTWRKKEEPITVPGYREELAEGVSLTLVRIPEGEFEMGSPDKEEGRSPDEGPRHRVRLKSFFLGQTPVTQAEWAVVAGWPRVEIELIPHPSSFKGANRPVESVTWVEAMEFCRRLSQRSGRTYTLPSESQWEYACRAGTTTPFAFGETLTTDLANYAGGIKYGMGPKGVDRQGTTDVRIFPANAWGLHDMHGNLWEWCSDLWNESYAGAPTDGSPWLNGDTSLRLLRGGSWFDGPQDCRSAYRGWDHPDGANGGRGFRVCCRPQD